MIDVRRFHTIINVKLFELIHYANSSVNEAGMKLNLCRLIFYTIKNAVDGFRLNFFMSGEMSNSIPFNIEYCNTRFHLLKYLGALFLTKTKPEIP